MEDELRYWITTNTDEPPTVLTREALQAQLDAAREWWERGHVHVVHPLRPTVCMDCGAEVAT